MTRRQQLRNTILLIAVMGVVLPSAALIANNYLFHLPIIKRIAVMMYVLPLSILFGFVAHIGIKYKSPYRYWRYCKLRRSLEKNLISIKAYEQKEGSKIKMLPQVRIHENCIIIDLNNIKIRKAIEQYADTWSSALPGSFVVEEVDMSENANQFILRYEDISLYKQESYTVAEFKEKMRVLLESTEIYFDRKHIVDLLSYSHWLIVGMTGSGKSTLIEQIIMQSIFHRYDTRVADIHRALSMYSDFVDYNMEPDTTLDMLRDVRSEMRKRMEAIGEAKKRGITALGLGFQPMLVLIEEYIDLKNCCNKEQAKELEEIILALAVGARKAGIFLFISSQSIGVDIVPASVKNNFSKILLGNAASNIVRSTFGEQVEIPKVSFKNKGEGLICIDNKATVLKCAYISDLEEKSIGRNK